MTPARDPQNQVGSRPGIPSPGLAESRAPDPGLIARPRPAVPPARASDPSDARPQPRLTFPRLTFPRLTFPRLTFFRAGPSTGSGGRGIHPVQRRDDLILIAARLAVAEELHPLHQDLGRLRVRAQQT